MYWCSPESGGLWCKSRQWKQTSCSPTEGGWQRSVCSVQRPLINREGLPRHVGRCPGSQRPPAARSRGCSASNGPVGVFLMSEVPLQGVWFSTRWWFDSCVRPRASAARAVAQLRVHLNILEGVQFKNNYLTEMCSGSEEGSYSRLIDFVCHSPLGLRVIKQRRRLLRLSFECTCSIRVRVWVRSSGC